MATLDTALDKLSDLFSKDFVVNSVPVIAFLFLHGAVAYNVLPSAREFIATHFLSDQNVITALFTLLFTVVLTYVLAALNSPLRELLEGKHWPKWLANAFRQKYLTRLDRIEQKMGAARSAGRELKDRQDDWVQRLSEAIELGKTKPSGDYSRSPMLDELARQVAWNKGVSYTQVELAVTDLCSLLLANDTSLERAKKLVEDQERLVILIARAIDQWDAIRVRLQNQIHFELAGRNVAPTRMGNLATVAAYYADSRYSLDLDIFWTTLQKVIQGDAELAAVLQNSKQKLDFLVALFWQTVFFTGVWMVALFALGRSPQLFLTIAVGGSFFAWIWYQIAVTNYRDFSNVVRAGIDLHRLGVLKELHILAPANMEQERLTWQTLGQRVRYAERDNIPLEPGS